MAVPKPERFATRVQSVADLAPPVEAALRARLLPGETVQPFQDLRQIIFAPRQDYLDPRMGLRRRLRRGLPWRKTPDWVLALTGERLLLATLPAAPEAPRVSATPFTGLLWIELGTILLYSWLEWSWVDEGGLHLERVQFNTVGERYFWGIVDTICRTIMAQSGRALPPGEHPQQSFSELPFKFRNLIANRLLFPGERVDALVYQPSIRGRRLGMFRQQRAPSTVLVLSSDHLVVAHDDRTNLVANYGLVSRYCPRDRLRSAALERAEDDLWLKVVLGLNRTEETLRLLFEPAREPDLEALLARI